MAMIARTIALRPRSPMSMLKFMGNSFSIARAFSQLESVYVLSQLGAITSSKPLAQRSPQVRAEKANGYSFRRSMIKQTDWQVWMSSSPIIFSQKMLTPPIIKIQTTKPITTQSMTLCIQRSSSQVNQQFIPLNICVTCSESYQKTPVDLNIIWIECSVFQRFQVQSIVAVRMSILQLQSRTIFDEGMVVVKMVLQSSLLKMGM